jgi:rfaE bifunctional protein nucleotidyltransferase chain/domain
MSVTSAKIKSIDELTGIVQGLKNQGKRVVHCHGVFDLLHPGHIKHLEAARCEGDVLVVTVTRDEYVGKGPGRPVFNHRLRAESIAALGCVDYVAINHWPTAVETIKVLKPDLYVKGSDYAEKEKDITGGIYAEEEAILSVGGKIKFTDELTFSSTQLLNEYLGVYPEPTHRFLREFRERYPADDVIRYLKSVQDLKVMVIGEAIIDEYFYCEAQGKSPKETIVSTRYLSQERFAGGALACANHVAGLCRQVELVSCLGRQNPQEDFIRKHLKPNVNPVFFYREDTCTVVKRRFVEPAFLTKMFQICYLTNELIPPDVEKEICSYLGDSLKMYDLVIVADYGHGLFTSNIIELIYKRSNFSAVATQTNSANIGFNMITKYPNIGYICIDEPEIRLAVHDRFGRLEDIIRIIARDLGCKRITITRGHLGSIAYDGGDRFYHIPVFSTKVVDRVGAGDAYLSITAPCVANNTPMEVVGFIGNVAGAIAVSIVCNRSPIEPVPLMRFISTLLR